MTYLEMKKKVLSLIEEITDVKTAETGDNDIDTKLPYVTNQIMYELARIKKIPAYYEKEVVTDEVMTFTDMEEATSDTIYQIDTIGGVDSDLRGKRITFLEDGLAKIYYFKYPARIDEKTTNTYEFELDEDVLLTLTADAEYLKLQDDLQKMVQEEMLKSIRWKVNMNPVAITKMDRLKELIVI